MNNILHFAPRPRLPMIHAHIPGDVIRMAHELPQDADPVGERELTEWIELAQSLGADAFYRTDVSERRMR